jgi:hypothetical protein
LLDVRGAMAWVQKPVMAVRAAVNFVKWQALNTWHWRLVAVGTTKYDLVP